MCVSESKKVQRLDRASINEDKNSMKTKIQFHFFIHLQSNNKLYIINIFINF